MGKYTYKSYAWSIGTTSLRMADIGAKIELQLNLLDEFWSNPAVATKTWQDAQDDYYDFLYAKGYVDGSITVADKKRKTARQKTSGVTDLGLIDDQRKITPAGRDLLALLNSGHYKDTVSDFDIAEDEMLYFKQLIKVMWTDSKNSTNFVRPFLVLGYVLVSCDNYLTYDEFRYLLPLCISDTKTNLVIQKIADVRAGITTISQSIIDIVLSNANYQTALNDFISANPMSPQMIMDIGMNRDGTRHDAPYVNLFDTLHSVIIDGRRASAHIQNIYDATKSLSSGPGSLWRKLLFGTKKTRLQYSDLQSNMLTSAVNESDFRTAFFVYMHLFKITKTLDDYFDLNRRYIKMSEAVEFDMSKVQFTTIFKAYFDTDAKQIFNDRYSPSVDLDKNIALTAISPILAFNKTDVITAFNVQHGTAYTEIADIKTFIERQKYVQFNRLIDTKFSDENLKSILKWFENRGSDDKNITDFISNAGGDCEDVPTIFEYIVGVIWYKISNRQGEILKYMNLSLDTNQLPKTHAGGFEPDIAYKYPANMPLYPEHTLLLECTLMDSSTQRRGEMEPVTRHLGQYILEEDRNAYCSFVTTKLVLPIISDFRARKNNMFFPYNEDDSKYVESMNIVPIDTKDLAVMLDKGLSYDDIYKIFMDAYNSNEGNPKVWRDTMIVDILNSHT